jgi:hypothetical protein
VRFTTSASYTDTRGGVGHVKFLSRSCGKRRSRMPDGTTSSEAAAPCGSVFLGTGSEGRFVWLSTPKTGSTCCHHRARTPPFRSQHGESLPASRRIPSACAVVRRGCIASSSASSNRCCTWRCLAHHRLRAAARGGGDVQRKTLAEVSASYDRTHPAANGALTVRTFSSCVVVCCHGVRGSARVAFAAQARA